MQKSLISLLSLFLVACNHETACYRDNCPDLMTYAGITVTSYELSEPIPCPESAKEAYGIARSTAIKLKTDPKSNFILWNIKDCPYMGGVTGGYGSGDNWVGSRISYIGLPPSWAVETQREALYHETRHQSPFSQWHCDSSSPPCIEETELNPIYRL